VVQQLIEKRLDGGELGCEVGFQVVNAGIGGIHIRCEMFDGDMGLIEGSFDFLVSSGGNLERESVGKEKNGSVGPQKERLRIHRYHDDQCMEGNKME